MDIARIDNTRYSADDFVKQLKLENAFGTQMDEFMSDRLIIMEARSNGISVDDSEIQDRVDQFRRVQGLHRAQDTHDYLEALGVNVVDFESYIADSLYREKMLSKIASKDAIEEYFRLNSPKFDSVEVSHIVVDSEGKAKELMAVLTDDPDSFAAMAREHSLDDETRSSGGRVGQVLRGSLASEAEAKVFGAEVGDLIGPFASDDELTFEIFRINGRRGAQLDEDTAKSVAQLVQDEWIRARTQEHQVELL